MSWMRKHVQRVKSPDYAESVLSRYKLGMKAGGAIAGLRIIAGANSCATCRALVDRVYDPDSAPAIPIAGCTALSGCRCTYVPVMTYELGNWQLDHRRKSSDYAESVLARLRLAIRATGAVAGVRIVTARGSCPTCVGLSQGVYHPDEAPRIPIAACTAARGCCCAYAVAAAYEIPGTG